MKQKKMKQTLFEKSPLPPSQSNPTVSQCPARREAYPDLIYRTRYMRLSVQDAYFTLLSRFSLLTISRGHWSSPRDLSRLTA